MRLIKIYIKPANPNKIWKNLKEYLKSILFCYTMISVAFKQLLYDANVSIGRRNFLCQLKWLLMDSDV